MICKCCGWDTKTLDIKDYQYYNGWRCPACDYYNVTVFDYSPIPVARKSRNTMLETEILSSYYASLNLTSTGLIKIADLPIDIIKCAATKIELTLLYSIWESNSDCSMNGWLLAVPCMNKKTAKLLESYASKYTNGLTWARFLTVVRKDRMLHPAYEVWRVEGEQ